MREEPTAVPITATAAGVPASRGVPVKARADSVDTEMAAM
jgi:hypothetical protein